VDGADRMRRRLVALSLAPRLGAVRIARLLEHFGSIDAAWLAPQQALLGIRGFGPATAAALITAREDEAAVRTDAMLRRAAARGTRVVTWLDDAYPARLRGIPASPPVVYVRGVVGASDRPAVAIVGTRRASPYGMGVAERLAAALAARGVDIISGLARGIDGAAHRGALRSGGCTVGVLGCGVDVVYPPEHRSLMEAMIRTGGALIAEAPMGTRPGPGLFPARNRLISGMADAVVVVEGGADSGAMITASCAIAQGRALFAVPGSVYAPGSRGPHRLLADGARVLAGPEDVLAVLRRPAVPPAGTGQAGRSGPADAVPGVTGRGVRRRGHEGISHGGISTAERRVLAAVDRGEARSVDRVAAAAGVDVSAAASALVALEVLGAVRRVAGGLYVRDAAVPGGDGWDDCMSTGGTAWRDHWS
jgi:DNA processing protein